MASQVVRAVAHVVAGTAAETKKGSGHGLGEPMTKEAKKKMKWEKMMKEIAVSGSAVAVLQSHREAGKLSKQTILGTLIRLRQLNLWARVTEVNSNSYHEGSPRFQSRFLGLSQDLGGFC